MTEARHLQLLNRLRAKHLLVLAAIADAGSIHKAALQLNLSQPAASKLLRETEEAFGVVLFDRTAKGIAPNQTGIALVARARAVLRDLQLMRDEAVPADENIGGRVAVGTYVVATPLLLPLTIMRLRTTHPKVLVMVEEGTNAALIPGLQRGDLDCVIGRDTQDVPADIKRIPLFPESVVVVCGPHHELLRLEGLEFSGLSKSEWILPPQHHPLRNTLEAQFTVLGLPRPRLMLESVSTLTNVSILQRSSALALLPNLTAQYLASLGLIGILPITFPVSSAPVAILVQQEEGSATRGAFIAAAQAVASSTDGRLGPIAASQASPGSIAAV